MREMNIGSNSIFNTDSMQHRGLSPEDLLYPFNRQFWHEHYNDLLQSRPIDPHSMTYEEAMFVQLTLFLFSQSLIFCRSRTESRTIQRFLHPQVRLSPRKKSKSKKNVSSSFRRQKFLCR